MKIRDIKIPGKKPPDDDAPKHRAPPGADLPEYRGPPGVDTPPYRRPFEDDAPQYPEPPKDEHLFAVIKRIKKTLLSMKNSLENIADILYFSTARRLPDVLDTGIIQISIATPNIPDSPDTIANPPLITGYDRLQINHLLNRNSPRLTVINDGPGILYILSSDDGETWSDTEVTVRYGEIRVFNNVFELHLRSPVTTSYRVTEGEISTSFAVVTAYLNRDAFDAGRTIPAAAGVAETLPDIAIPDGYSLVIKALLANAGVVYIADNAADAIVVNNSYSLAANEFVRLKVTNANLVWLNAAVLNDGIEYIVEV